MLRKSNSTVFLVACLNILTYFLKKEMHITYIKSGWVILSTSVLVLVLAWAWKLYFLHMWVVGLIYCSVCVGVKPYACSMCDMRFIQRNHLERHSLTHTGMRSFTVPLLLRKVSGACNRTGSQQTRVWIVKSFDGMLNQPQNTCPSFLGPLCCVDLGHENKKFHSDLHIMSWWRGLFKNIHLLKLLC